MGGESIAWFAAKATMDGRQFVQAANETTARAKQMARDFRELDRKAKSDAASSAPRGAGRGSLDDAISWGKAITAIHAAEKALGAVNDALAMAGTKTEKFQALLEGLPFVGGLAREGRRFGEWIDGGSPEEFRKEAAQLEKDNERTQEQLRQAKADKAKKAKDERDRAAKDEVSRQERVNKIFADQKRALDELFYTEEQRRRAKGRDRLQALEDAGGTVEEVRALAAQLKEERRREDVVKRIDDTNENMANVTQEMREENERLNDEFDYMLGVQKEIDAVKQKQLDKERRIAEAGKRSIAAMEAGTTAAYSAILRGGARTRTDAGMMTVLQRIAANTGSTARGVQTNRVSTVDAL